MYLAHDELQTYCDFVTFNVTVIHYYSTGDLTDGYTYIRQQHAACTQGAASGVPGMLLRVMQNFN